MLHFRTPARNIDKSTKLLVKPVCIFYIHVVMLSKPGSGPLIFS